MANQQHLDVLRQGVEGWNQWREEHTDIQPDLSGAQLVRANLGWVPRGNDIQGRANLVNANFSSANLSWADLTNANLSGANLSKVDIGGADLTGANLTKADLSEASLTDTNLSWANLNGTLFNQAFVLRTLFTNVDLRTAQGLETVRHHGPSSIGLDTIYRSQGEIPESFLQGAGVPESFLTYMRSLVSRPFDYYNCFISYSSVDTAFAKRLYADLQSNDIRCWFAPEDLKTGDKIRDRIDESIRLSDKLLVVLSQHSIASSWVEKEVETALEKERLRQQLVLFPIRIDESVMETTQAWAADLRRSRHIGDFTSWKNHDDYQQGLSRLLRDLKAESRK